MSLTLTITNDANGNSNHWSDTKRLHVLGTVVALGNYTTGGVALSFSNPLIKSNTNPLFVLLTGQANIYKFTYYQATGKVIVYDNTGTEIAAAAFPAAILADVLNFYGIFPKFI